MTDHDPDQRECTERHAGNSTGIISETGIFSYYRDDNPETEGLKIKWTIRVADGEQAARLDARQSRALRELLQWALDHYQPQDRPSRSPSRSWDGPPPSTSRTP